MGRVRAGRPEKSLLLTGLRGVGKTVLLNEIERQARAQGYRTLALEAYEGKALGALLAPGLRSLLYELDRLAGAGHKVRRALAVLRSFIGGLRISVGEASFGLDIEPEKGAADSGDLQIDLPRLFVAVAEAAQERAGAVAIFMDEIQYLQQKELGALIMAMHKVQQGGLPRAARRRPAAAAGAGGRIRVLCRTPVRLSQSARWARRTRPRHCASPRRPSRWCSRTPRLWRRSTRHQGLPVFPAGMGLPVLEPGHASPITLAVGRVATPTVIARLDRNFFRVRFDRLSPSESNTCAPWPRWAPACSARGISPTSWAPG